MKKETVYPVQRNYKDTLFRMIFSDKKALLSLYNAISEKDYKDPDELEIVTLENAIYMNKKNDLAFLIDSSLNCVPSMALILLVKVQSRVFTAKCSEPQVGISNGMDGGSGVAKFLSLRTET